MSAGQDSKEGSIIFHLANGAECLRFEPDGKVFVRGEQVDDNMAIYKQFKLWLELFHESASKVVSIIDQELSE